MTGTLTPDTERATPTHPLDDRRSEPTRRRAGQVVSTAIAVGMVILFLLLAWNSEWAREATSRALPFVPVGLYLVVALACVVEVARRLRPQWFESLDGVRRWRPAIAVTPLALGGGVVLYLSSLVHSWETGARGYFTIAGIVPWSDAEGYFGGAERLLFDNEIDSFTSLHPLNTVYLAGRLALTGLDLRRALVLQTIVVAIAAFLAARTVARDLGPLAGLALFCGIYGFAAFHVESTMTETLGVTFGCLAFATLWTAVREFDALLAAVGIFLLGVGLATRAGALALLVVLPAWFAWQLRGQRRVNWRALGLCGGAVILALGTNYFVIYTLSGDPDAVAGNAGYTTYGLAVGIPGWDPTRTGWTQSYYDYPEEMSERSLTERIEFVADRTREEIREHPTRFLKALARSGQNYAKLSQEAVMGPVSNTAGRQVLYSLAAIAAAAFLVVRWRSARWWAFADAALVGCTLFALPVLVGSWPGSIRRPFWIVLGIFVATVIPPLAIGVERLRLPFHVGFVLAAFAGIIVSTPLLADGGVRVLATTIPFLAVPLALAASLLRRPDAAAPAPAPRRSTGLGSPFRVSSVVGLGLVGAVLFGGPLAAALVGKPDVEKRSCPDGQQAKAFLGGESVRLANEPFEEELGEFAAHLYSPGNIEIAQLIKDARPGSTLLGAIDEDGDEYIVVASNIDAPPRQSVLYVCGVHRRDALTEETRRLTGEALHVFVGRALDD